jgi:two-component system phosphate regulon response regulator PhoB
MSKETALILIVEDEPGIAELLQFTLTNAGYSVEITGTAAAARDAVTTILPQLVLLDWMLPDASGLDLLREWRADVRTAKLAIVMLTAKGMDEDKVRGVKAGADDFVTKPFSPRELIARIEALLRTKRTADPFHASELRT